MLSGVNITFQILESERHLIVSNILNLCFQQPSFKQTSLQNFVLSFSLEDEDHSHNNVNSFFFLNDLIITNCALYSHFTALALETS